MPPHAPHFHTDLRRRLREEQRGTRRRTATRWTLRVGVVAAAAAIVVALDIGTSKIACMSARLRPCPANGALRGRSHAAELIGYSQIQSRGVKAGAVTETSVELSWTDSKDNVGVAGYNIMNQGQHLRIRTNTDAEIQ